VRQLPGKFAPSAREPSSHLLDDAVRQRWNELLYAVDRTAGDRLRVLEKRLFSVFACLFDVVGATGAGTSPPLTDRRAARALAIDHVEAELLRRHDRLPLVRARCSPCSSGARHGSASARPERLDHGTVTGPSTSSGILEMSARTTEPAVRPAGATKEERPGRFLDGATRRGARACCPCARSERQQRCRRPEAEAQARA
jgi:hypothetical protein